jgi:hypothetical protein
MTPEEIQRVKDLLPTRTPAFGYGNDLKYPIPA